MSQYLSILGLADGCFGAHNMLRFVGGAVNIDKSRYTPIPGLKQMGASRSSQIHLASVIQRRLSFFPQQPYTFPCENPPFLGSLLGLS